MPVCKVRLELFFLVGICLELRGNDGIQRLFPFTPTTTLSHPEQTTRIPQDRPGIFNQRLPTIRGMEDFCVFDIFGGVVEVWGLVFGHSVAHRKGMFNNV